MASIVGSPTPDPMPPNNALSSTHERPVALVTGSARRIGRAIALELAAQGWALALHHRHSASETESLAAELRAQGAGVQVMQADLADEAQARQLAQAVVRQCGRWDAVVNNASLFEYDDVGTFGYQALTRHLLANTAAGQARWRRSYSSFQSAAAAGVCPAVQSASD